MARKKKTQTPTESNDKIYFSAATEAAIVQYNNSDDPIVREHIFRGEIAKPLDKLAENVINRFQFPYVQNSFDNVKREVVSMLVMNLSKYTQDKGKAFSYFSVIAKNYLILQNNNAYRDQKRSVYLSESGEETVSIDDVGDMLEAPNERGHEDTREFVRLLIEYWDRNLTCVFKKKRDIDIATAVIELFRRANGIENFNKKALYLMIREMTDCKTNYITKVVNKMRSVTAHQWRQYNDTGMLDPDDSEFFRYD